MDENLGVPVMAIRNDCADRLQGIAVQLREPTCDLGRLYDELCDVTGRIDSLCGVQVLVMDFPKVEVMQD